MHHIRALIVTDPDKAKREILKAFTDEEAHLLNTAKRLNASWKSLYRWLDELDIRGDIDRIRVRKASAIEARAIENGRMGGVVGGRPRKTAQRTKKNGVKGGRPHKARRRSG